MLKTILVPLDGSVLAWRVVPYATRLARAARARLVLLHVTSSNGRDRPSRFELDAMADGLRRSGVEVQPVLYHAAPDDLARAICDAAREQQADLIVMSTHGRGGPGRWLYGSVADEVLRLAELPLLLVPAICERTWPDHQPLRIVVPLDGSAFAEAGLKGAAELAEVLQAGLLLLRVVEPPTYGPNAEVTPASFNAEAELAAAQRYLERIGGTLATAVKDPAVLAVIGFPDTTIASVAHAEGVHLIAMATHGRSGLARLVLGSVATGTIQRADVPLLLIRPEAVRRLEAPEKATVAAV